MTDSALETLLAKQAITEVLYRYCRAMDRMDTALAVSVWHPGGTADYGSMFQGTGAGFVAWVEEQHAGFDAHSHQIANILIEVDGDSAASEAYVTATIRAIAPDGSATHLSGRGRYLDRWSKRAGVWAVDHRIYLHDLQTSTPVPADDLAAARLTRARRDRDDPSYALFRKA